MSHIYVTKVEIEQETENLSKNSLTGSVDFVFWSFRPVGSILEFRSKPKSSKMNGMFSFPLFVLI
ncbi:hypothetical protein CH373_16540 [Leptospira perolatii]|uniref:Uncharacterized protein n=1 Tax=Leptospira perolatii TaxID=2023191 RepID=A0A2M9ZJ02_9LEPT|nr:hypothetical protein CH360_15085 [Leptospira perolatii]PJZ71954.1 hypothetical protein CH373_16540 [Leptospira perolatii]